MVNFKSFRGVITQISDFPVGQNGDRDGCYKMMSVEDGVGGVVNFVISPSTYFVNQEVVTVGEWVTGYYDGDAPVPMIYPPQYRALIVIKESPTNRNLIVIYGPTTRSIPAQTTPYEIVVWC